MKNEDWHIGLLWVANDLTRIIDSCGMTENIIQEGIIEYESSLYSVHSHNNNPTPKAMAET